MANGLDGDLQGSGDHLLYREPINLCRGPFDGLDYVLLELWEAEVPDKRWASMQYRIEDGTFEASFTYEPLDSAESMLERRERILQQRYGNKRIDYPPLDLAE